MANEAPADPARIAAVLWGPLPAPSRGPAPKLTRARLVDAALAVVEADGLDALAMRSVAAHLGVGVATLYTYVPGRAELLALVLDECVGRQELPGDLPGTWRDRIEAWARADYADYRARPWLLALAGGPVVAGPQLTRWYESALSVLDGLGLTAAETVGVIDSVDAYVRGMARAAQGEVTPPPTDPESPVPATGHPFPTLARLTEEGGFDDPHAAFELGLGCLLDGVAGLVARRPGAARLPDPDRR